MRITCPNCDAQYEVDDRAIPDTGRDVQCSNCGHAWFQLPPQHEAALEDEAATFGEPVPAPALGAEPEPSAEPASAAAPEAAPPAAASPSFAPWVEPEFEPDAEEAARLTPAPQRRPLDENIQAVLREEAARERRARESEGGAAEAPATPGPAPQPATTVVQPLPKGLYDLDEDEAEEEAPVEEAARARRDLLPDIEQINSTLRAGSSPVADQGAAAVSVAPPPPRTDSGRGFRSGFRLVLLLVIIGLVVYVLAPGLSENVPALAKPLQAYVAKVNSYRDWIDHLLLRAVAGLKGG